MPQPLTTSTGSHPQPRPGLTLEGARGQRQGTSVSELLAYVR